MLCRFVTIFILFRSLGQTNGSCRTCQTNSAICYDAKRFAMCSEGVPDEIFSCPDGYVCTSEPEICLQSTANDPVTASCEEACDQCRSPGKLFACLGETTYAWCFGEDLPDYGARGECPSGYVCNLDSKQVCTSAADVYPSCFEGVLSVPSTLATPTSPHPTASSVSSMIISSSLIDNSLTSSISSSTTSTTSSSTTDSNIPAVTLITHDPRDESAFCRAKQQGGLFRPENDAPCQEFILCYILSGEHLGLRYTCKEGMFFNGITKKCQIDKPSDC